MSRISEVREGSRAEGPPLEEEVEEIEFDTGKPLRRSQEQHDDTENDIGADLREGETKELVHSRTNTMKRFHLLCLDHGRLFENGS
jgi:hypothetical protein